MLDPQRFPYAPDVLYRPAQQEVGDARYFLDLMACHRVEHALLVGPNSGYGSDNRCLLYAIALGREGRAVVKISGYAKFSLAAYPFPDVRAYADALVQHFGVAQCVWASDWPYLRAPYRLDYGPMLKVFESQFSPSERAAILWDSPKHHFGF